MMTIDRILFNFLLGALLSCILTDDSLELPVKCFEEYKKFSGTEFKFCIQGTQTDESSSKLCQSGEYLSIFDFYIYLPREPEKTCGVLGGFTYKNTVTASCLHKENKHLAQRIAKTLITAYSGDQFENVNKTHVNMQLNNIVKQLALITVNYLCHPKNNSFIEMCKMSTVEGWNKGNIELDENSLKNLNLKPSSCECFVRSSKSNVSIEVLDARLGSSEKLQIIQGNSSSASNLFDDSSFIWRKDGQKVLVTDSIIKLVMKNFTLIDSLWIVIEGQNMSVNCSHVYKNDSETSNPPESESKSGEFSVGIVIAIAIGAVVLVIIITIIIIVICRRRNNTHNRSMTEMEDSFSTKQFDTKGEVIYSEPGTPTPVSDSPEKPLMTNYFELDKEHVYAEPGPPNNNSKNVTTFGHRSFSTDENKEKVLQKNIYNHLGDRPAISHGNIYDTSGNNEYSTVERNKRPKVVDNVYDQ